MDRKATSTEAMDREATSTEAMGRKATSTEAAPAKNVIKIEKPNGRPKKKGYSAAQLMLIENSFKGGMGYVGIAKKYADQGLKASGAEEVTKKLKKMGPLGALQAQAPPKKKPQRVKLLRLKNALQKSRKLPSATYLWSVT